MKDSTKAEIETQLMLNKAGIIGPVKITQGTKEPQCKLDERYPTTSPTATSTTERYQS